MADPLSLLRHYNVNGKQIEEKDDKYIIFGEFSWPKTVKTNFRIYGSEDKDTGRWEYYTLETLLYFLKNTHLSHPAYVRQAASEDVEPVVRPDRRDLLAYLRGTDGAVPKSIDKSARLEMPTHVKRSAESSSETPIQAKKVRLDTQQTPSNNSASQQQLKDRLAAKLAGEKQDGKLSINRANLKNLSEDLTTDKIAEIRAKLISNRRTRIKPEDDDAKASSLPIGDLEVSRESSTLFRRERQWRTRTTILQSTGKSFSKTILAILNSVRMREDGKLGGKAGIGVGNAGIRAGMANAAGVRPGVLGSGAVGANGPPRPGGGNLCNMLSQPRQLPNYNRYNQDWYRGKDDTHGFNIETTGTFSGMTLKSVTEGDASQGQPGRKPNPNASRNATPTNGTVATPSPAAGIGGNNPSGKRPSRTPIIIIPAAPKSLITMYNAKDILQDLKFLSTEDKKASGAGLKRENELLIQRRKDGNLTVPYRVIDNPAKLTNADWDRVVAVFVMGQAWQFKGWPWDGNPTFIFSKISAFHLKWDESNLEKNIANWAVNVIQLSRNKRHLDRARLMVFWETLDRYMVNNKPHLRF